MSEPMFTPRKDGAYDISAPGVIILLGSYAYEPDSPNPPWWTPCAASSVPQCLVGSRMPTCWKRSFPVARCPSESSNWQRKRQTPQAMRTCWP